MNILDRRYIVSMPDGSKWSVPIVEIAMDRAKYYADEVGGDINASLHQDTLPLFEGNHSEINDWATGNMDWDDVKDSALKISNAEEQETYQEGWLNGEWEIEEEPE